MRIFLRWLCARCPLNENRTVGIERRKVSPEGREKYEEFTRERADVERRLELVDMQSKVIAHVTGNGEGREAVAKG
jgi:hypothetical protein